MDSIRSRFRWIMLCLVMLLVFSHVPSASAQGLFRSLSGLPSFGAFWGNGSTCTPTEAGFGPFTFYAGWGSHRNGATTSFDVQQTGTDDLTSIINTYPIGGVWLGLAVQANPNNRIGLYADGWILIPSNRQADESYSIAAPLTGSKTWRTSSDWWFVDGAVTYNPLSLGKLVAGFRYDRFATNLKNPRNFVGALGLSSDRGDVTINSYIPFVGVQVEQGTPGGSQVMFRIIGFPWLAGDVKFHDSIGGFGAIIEDRIELSKGIGEGYFLEAFAEYSRPVFGNGRVGLFGRWNMTHGNADSVDITDVLGGFPLTGKYQFAFDRLSWTLGGSFSMDFDLPL